MTPMPKPFPFVPPMEDCRRVVRAEGCTCYIMDTRCRDMSAKDRAAVEEQILRVLVSHGVKKAGPGPDRGAGGG